MTAGFLAARWGTWNAPAARARLFRSKPGRPFFSCSSRSVVRDRGRKVRRAAKVPQQRFTAMRSVRIAAEI